jgi:hypothetical protein
VVEDLSKVLDRRTECVLEASKALTESGVPFVIGGRDAVNAYCPGVVEETLRKIFSSGVLIEISPGKSCLNPDSDSSPLTPHVVWQPREGGLSSIMGDHPRNRSMWMKRPSPGR